MVIRKKKELIDNFVHEALLFDIDPTVDYIKEQLQNKQKKVKPDVPPFLTFFAQFIQEMTPIRKQLTIRSYKHTLKTLQQYADFIGKPLNYEDLDMTFYNSFLSYLYSTKKLSANSAGGYFKVIKLIAGVSLERGYHKNIAWKNKAFKTLQEVSDGIYCTEEELTLLYNYDFSYDKRLEHVRDTFICGSYTALRYSDLSRLQAANIQNGTIVVNTKKTDERVVIPIHPRVKAIIEKYQKSTGSPWPPVFKNEQKFNFHLKEVARIVGGPFSQSVIKRISIAGRPTQLVQKKSELMCSHVARRTCATNLAKAGLPIPVIQKITGHKTLKALMIYLKQSQEESAAIVQQFWNKQDTTPPVTPNNSVVPEPVNLN